MLSLLGIKTTEKRKNPPEDECEENDNKEDPVDSVEEECLVDTTDISTEVTAGIILLNMIIFMQGSEGGHISQFPFSLQGPPSYPSLLNTSITNYGYQAYSGIGRTLQFPFINPFYLRGFPVPPSLFRQVTVLIIVKTESFMLLYFSREILGHLLVLGVIKYSTLLMD